MKKTLFLLFAICMFCCGCIQKQSAQPLDDLKTIQNRGELIVGVKTDTKPFGYYDENGKLTGFDIELSKNIAKSILGNENKIKFVPVTPSNRIITLDSGDVDILIATMSITEQRSQIVNFSTPYYTAGQAIMVNKQSDITSIKNLNNKRVIIVFGSTSERSIRMSIPGVVIIGYKTYPEAFKALKENKADAMIADDTILLGYSISDSSVKLLPQRYSKELYAVAFRKDESSKTLESKLDVVINSMISSGKIDQMRKKWGV